MNDLRIAAVCMNSQPGETEKNLRRIESFVLEASEKGVDIICFPELSITGYVLKNPTRIISSSLNEEITERVEGMARDKGLVIMAGMIEMADGDKPFISHMVAGPDGLMGTYRKTHLSPQEKESYQPGQTLDTFAHKDIIFGVQLCYESHFPEISTVMALKGAKIIFMPHASPRGNPEEKIQSWLRHLPGRAFDNALFVVACNQVGKTREGYSFPGTAVVLNPAGWIIAQYGENKEKLVLADLRLDELEEIKEHRMKYFIRNRRPELYKELLAS
jgi:N-carbamoylputrescine amidase